MLVSNGQQGARDVQNIKCHSWPAEVYCSVFGVYLRVMLARTSLAGTFSALREHSVSKIDIKSMGQF